MSHKFETRPFLADKLQVPTASSNQINILRSTKHALCYVQNFDCNPLLLLLLLLPAITYRTKF